MVQWSSKSNFYIRKAKMIEKVKSISRNTLILALVLVVCVIVLVMLVASLVQIILTPVPAAQPEVEWIELPNILNMPLEQAKSELDKLGISYEITHTDSAVPNRVERFEYTGKKEGEKDLAQVGTSVIIYSNVVDPNKIVYLTFDDGPTFSNTFDILDTLDIYNAKATFFILGNRVIEYDDRILATYERGHLLACHSYSHDLDRTSASFVYASIDTFLNEIEMYESAMKKVLGDEAFASMPKLLRFPGGSSTNNRITKAEALEYIAAVRQSGYSVYDWTALTGDAEGNKDAASFIEYLKKGLKNAEEKNLPIIILMHDKLTTNEALPEILDFLVSEGYYFDTLDNCPEYTFAEQ